MYSVRKLVFYCGFCKKYKLTSFAMKVHEAHCTMNPDRKCRMPGCRNGACPLCQFAKDRQSMWTTGEWYDRNLREEVREWRKKFWQPHDWD